MTILSPEEQEKNIELRNRMHDHSDFLRNTAIVLSIIFVILLCTGEGGAAFGALSNIILGLVGFYYIVINKPTKIYGGRIVFLFFGLVLLMFSMIKFILHAWWLIWIIIIIACIIGSIYFSRVAKSIRIF